MQTTIGWIFWDPGAVARYAAASACPPSSLGYARLVARRAPLAAAGPDAVIAAFGSISPLGIRLAFDLLEDRDRFDGFWAARDEAVVEGLRAHAPDIVDPLVELGPALWPVVDQLPAGRAACSSAPTSASPRPADPLLSGWHAVNCLREWRGDTHWALVAAAGPRPGRGLDPPQRVAGLRGRLAGQSRGTSPDDDRGGLGRASRPRAWPPTAQVTAEGIALRQQIEDDTDRLTTRALGAAGRGAGRVEFAERFEPPCEQLLARVDVTAGPNYMPASRLRPDRNHPRTGTAGAATEGT